MITELVQANRSCRRFYEDHAVDAKTLEALVEPKEEIVIESVGPDGSICYWRDAEGVHHVPKRSLQEIIVACHKA
jgi:hypothetical protein